MAIYVVTASSQVRLATFALPAGSDADAVLAEELEARERVDQQTGASPEAAHWLICDRDRVDDLPLLPDQEPIMASQGWVLLHDVPIE
jgi:hypothetical protein